MGHPGLPFLKRLLIFAKANGLECLLWVDCGHEAAP